MSKRKSPCEIVPFAPGTVEYCRTCKVLYVMCFKTFDEDGAPVGWQRMHSHDGPIDAALIEYGHEMERIMLIFNPLEMPTVGGRVVGKKLEPRPETDKSTPDDDDSILVVSADPNDDDDDDDDDAEEWFYGNDPKPA